MEKKKQSQTIVSFNKELLPQTVERLSEINRLRVTNPNPPHLGTMDHSFKLHAHAWWGRTPQGFILRQSVLR